MPLTTAHDSPSRLTIPSRPQAVLTVMWLAAISGGVFALDRGTGLPHVQHLYVASSLSTFQPMPSPAAMEVMNSSSLFRMRLPMPSA
jgi:hypothetical protein